MKVPVAIQHVETMDEELFEALGYLSEEVTTPAQVSSSPVVIGAGTPTKLDGTPDSTDEAMDSMLLSLEIQELFSSDEQDKAMPMPKKKVSPKSVSASDSPVQQQEQQPSSPKKIDRRLRPYSTSKRRNRRRPKHELDYLRAKVVELQEELATLGKADVGSPNAVGQEVALATIGATTGCFSSWKEIVERQKHGVDNSIDENRRLRNRLLGQLQVACVLEAAIQQHQNEAATSRDRLTSSGICGVSRPLVMSITDEQIFAQLNSNLEAQLAEVDGGFTTHGLSSVLHNLQGGFEFKREANGISFRHEEARLLPFPLQALHHAIWNSLHNGLVVKDTEAQVLGKDHSNLIFRDRLKLPKSHQISVTKRAAFRRHIEQDRVVFVWSSYVQIDGSVSVRLREKGWSTMSTFEFHRGVTQGADSSSNFVRGCITRMAIQLIPEVSEFKSEQEAQVHVGEMTDLIVGTYHHNFGLVHEVAERLLLSNGDTNETEVNREEGSITGVVRM